MSWRQHASEFLGRFGPYLLSLLRLNRRIMIVNTPIDTIQILLLRIRQFHKLLQSWIVSEDEQRVRRILLDHDAIKQFQLPLCKDLT